MNGVENEEPGEQVEVEQQVEDEQFEIDEGIDPRRRRPASRPSESVVRQHRATHIPFRDWCQECVAGAANGWPHKRGDPGLPLAVPEIHADYCFPKDRVGGDYVVVLVTKDRGTKMIHAHVVPCKGRHKYPIGRLKKNLDMLGHKK